MPRKSPRTATTLEHERALAASTNARYLGAVDEVGRGSLAGPVSVGMVVIDMQRVTEFPELRDSKLLDAATRERFIEQIRNWAVGYGVGHTSPAQIDELGMTAALRLAGTRAQTLCRIQPEAVLVDGSYDWLSAKEPDLFDLLETAVEPSGVHVPVRTIVKGDMTCQAIAAASILAKVERDDIMRTAAAQYPSFGWDINKGYATASHRQAIAEHGPSPLHRLSWRLTSGTEKVESESTRREED